MMDDAGKNWGNVRFGHSTSRPVRSVEQSSASRFTVGLVVFLGVAVVFPWYSYFVHSFLLGRELTIAARQLDGSIKAESQRAREQSAQDRRRQVAAARAQRVAAVRVMGVSQRTTAPVVIVRLGSASLEEARQPICEQAARWLRRSATGHDLRVQRHNGNRPATDVGTMRCP